MRKHITTMQDKYITAAKKVLTKVGIEPTAENIERQEDIDCLTINTFRGNDYCWYMDEVYDVCISVDTLEEVDPEEIGLC